MNLPDFFYLKIVFFYRQNFQKSIKTVYFGFQIIKHNKS